MTSSLDECRLGRLDSSRLHFRRRNCDLCGHDNTKAYCDRTHAGLTFTYVECVSCGLVYQNPLLDKESRRHVYGTMNYWQSRDIGIGSENFLNYYAYLNETANRSRMAALKISWMRPHLPVGARILDLGCSDGLLVKAMCNAGYEASGIDVSQEMISHGRAKFDVDIHAVNFEDEWPFDEQFDAITCFAALSNMIYPSRVFSRVRKYLKPGGRFYFNYGDRKTLAGRILGGRAYFFTMTAAHIYSSRCIKAYFLKNGLEIVQRRIGCQNLSLSRILGIFHLHRALGFLRMMGQDEIYLTLPLLMGYDACAVRR
jgi:2-polyprenyl-3-methyl-5-hydroxy-6-metoxy-1,4-benzoquinol methylase